MNNSILKIPLSLLLLGCLLPLPYGYFQLVRFVAMFGFSYLAYFAFEQKHKNEVFIYIALALLFQPFIKIALGRTIWNIVDVLVAIGLLSTIVLNPKKQK
jgi:asparagine N-glycosylation enzyme membrane subunit Stt3